ncbi:MAG TPA: hypothetical protein VNQ77_07240 [Frankiaceae bacterium]|nr:hypothetical protein [Frankiaceae bacterium]
MRRILLVTVLAGGALYGTTPADACHLTNPGNPRCWSGHADEAACPAFTSLAGSYGVVTVTSQGDVYVAGEPTWDCPPYDG